MSSWSIFAILAAFIPVYVAALRNVGPAVIGVVLLLCLATPLTLITWPFAIALALIWPKYLSAQG